MNTPHSANRQLFYRVTPPGSETLWERLSRVDGQFDEPHTVHGFINALAIQALIAEALWFLYMGLR